MTKTFDGLESNSSFPLPMFWFSSHSNIKIIRLEGSLINSHEQPLQNIIACFFVCGISVKGLLHSALFLSHLYFMKHPRELSVLCGACLQCLRLWDQVSDASPAIPSYLSQRDLAMTVMWTNRLSHLKRKKTPFITEY